MSTDETPIVDAAIKRLSQAGWADSLRDLERAANALRESLGDAQFKGREGDCPECERSQRQGHAQWCDLAAALRQFDALKEKNQ